MSGSRQGLRPKAPKQTEKRTTKSNAQKCREYRERLMAEDPVRDYERRLKNHANAKKWRDNLPPEKKERLKELARLYQRKRRQRLKEMGIYSSSTSTPKSDKTSKSTQTRVAKKLLKKNVDGKREQARVRQARRRAKIKASPETYQKEKEKRRKKYQEKKEKAANSVVKIVQRNQKRKGVPKKRCIILQ